MSRETERTWWYFSKSKNQKGYKHLSANQANLVVQKQGDMSGLEAAAKVGIYSLYLRGLSIPILLICISATEETAATAAPLTPAVSCFILWFPAI